MRDRTRRTRATAVVVVAALVGSALLGALASLGGGQGSVDVPAQGPWSVLVEDDLTKAAECTRDPVVVDGYVSADAPSSGGSLVLAADAEVADVERVVMCVARTIDPDRITVVTSPRDERAA